VKTLLFFLFAFLVFNTQAQFGSLDPTFGANGLSFYPLSSDPSVSDPIVPLPDGSYYKIESVSDEFYSAVKYTSSGLIDLSYGTDGYSEAVPISLNGAVAQEDGKLLLIGTTHFMYQPDIHTDIMVARFNTDGTIDQTFQQGGFLYISATRTTYDYVRDITIDDNVMIILASSMSVVSQLGIDHFITIKLSDGGVGQGMLTYTYGLDHYTPGAYSFGVQGDKVLAISSGYEVIYSEFEPVQYRPYYHASRYSLSGSLDPTFGNSGIIPLDEAVFPLGTKIGGQGSKVILTRSTYDVVSGKYGLTTTRLNEDGTPDLSFNGTGTQFTPLGQNAPVPTEIATQGDYLIIGGYVTNPATNLSEFLLLRYNYNGTLDTTFDTDGKQTTGLAGYSFYLEKMKVVGNRLEVYSGATSTAGTQGLKAIYILENNVPFICVPNKIVSTAAGLCTAVAIGIDPVNIQPANYGAIDYTLTGATTGAGKGTVSGTIFNKGITTITYTRSLAPFETCTFTVDVKDQEAPLITNISSSPRNLWPINSKMVNVNVNYTAQDNCGVVTSVLSATSSEVDAGGMKGDLAGDIKVIDNRMIQLRAESIQKKGGRLYTITITSTDNSGNETKKTLTVRVSKSAVVAREVYTDIIDEELSLLNVKVLSNPTTNHFTLKLRSSSKEKINMRVMNANGSVLERKNGLPANGQVQVGDAYINGIYLAEFTQGTQRVVVRLIKQQ
jgi:uncharacterized delta-60 repeat protein